MFPELWVHVGGGIDTQPHDGQEGWSSDPAAVLAWALRYAGRERVIPIIEQELTRKRWWEDLPSQGEFVRVMAEAAHRERA